MKITTILAFFSLIVLFGCSKLDEATTFDTTLDVPQTITLNASALVTKSAGGAEAVYSFDSSQDLNLADNNDVKDYLNKIKSIQLNSTSVSLSGIQPNESILTLSVKIDGTEVYSKTDINQDGTITPDISAQKLDFIAKQLEKNKRMTLNVSGTTNTPVMSFIIDHKFMATIKAKLL